MKCQGLPLPAPMVLSNSSGRLLVDDWQKNECKISSGLAGMARQLLPEAFEGSPDILCLKG